jgi:TorA maturation chaperone TorD
MPDKGKAFFCQILSSLFCPPDQGMVEQLSQGHLHAFFKSYVQSWEGEIGILKGFLTHSAAPSPTFEGGVKKRRSGSTLSELRPSGRRVEGLTQSPPQILLRDLKEEHHRLFSDTGDERISLVESFYKPWTQDPHCCLPFAKEKGFLMGDSAIHLSTLFQHCGLEIAGPFKGMPDHILIELEFLSFLYQEAGDVEIKRFIKDHLDWIPFLKESFEKVRAHPFYISLIEILDLFINQEKGRLEKKSDGEKDIHPEVI